MKVFSPSTIVNLHEFPEHKDIEIFAVYPIGFDISLWHNNGFSTAEALDWVVTYNFSSVETACLWKAQRLLPEDAKRWLWFAGMTPETARKLVDLKMTKEEFKQWTQRYIRAIDAPEWIIAGFTPQEAKGWYDKKFTPRDALSWKDIGVSPGDADLWRQNGYTEASSRKWREKGFSPEAAVDWGGMGVKSPSDAAFWLGTGLDAERIDLWLEAGYDTTGAQRAMEDGWDTPPPQE